MTSRDARRAAERAGINLRDLNSAPDGLAAPETARRMRPGLRLGLVAVVAAFGAALAGLIWGLAELVFDLPLLVAVAILAVTIGLFAAVTWRATRPGGPLVARLTSAPDDLEPATGPATRAVDTIRERAAAKATSALINPPPDVETLLTKSGWRVSRVNPSVPLLVAGSTKGAVWVTCCNRDNSTDAARQIQALRAQHTQLDELPVVLISLDGPLERIDGIAVTTRAKLTQAMNTAMQRR